MPDHHRIIQLDPSVAQRIAAGEVIDRPQAVVRELLDNAIDAHATTIDVYIENGGIGSLRIIDNGIGMSKEDLTLCCKSHTTSKISQVSDLYAIHTLGFRGEALASMAVCSKMTIMSSVDSAQTYTLSVTDGIEHGPTPGGYTKGTTIEVKDLFYSIPGRRNFLKSQRAEAAACKRVFIEKALAFPAIQFRFFSNGTMTLFLPKANSVQRIIDAYPRKFDPVFFEELHEKCGSFSLHLVCSTTALYRNDRSFIKIFINNRFIDDFTLVQAVQYGYNDYLPGGCFPYCFAFITVDPELVDFNIHPAKREVKLRIAKEIHHQLVETIKQHLYQQQQQVITDEENHQSSFTFTDRSYPQPAAQISKHVHHSPYTAVQASRNTPPSRDWIKEAHTAFDADTAHTPPRTPESSPTYDFIYLGQIFGVFLLVEREDTLYIIDQHAAHEKIIYQELTSHITQQPLLVPISFAVSDDIHNYISTHLEVYTDAGITLKQQTSDTRTWLLTALPNYARFLEDDIITFIQEHMGNPEEIIRSLFATISCKAAIKEGDVIDKITAIHLIEKAFSLEIPRCPHGRPLWTKISRSELYQAVKRTI